MAFSPLLTPAKISATFHKADVEEEFLLVENYKLVNSHHSRLFESG